jgi:hypothetical protein
VTKIRIRSILNLVRLAILPALLLAGLATHFWFWRDVDLHGRLITCTTDRKDERIDRRAHDDSWTPAFHVSLACASNDTGSYYVAPAFDTDEQEFDRIQKGSPFEVRYLSSVPLPLLLVGISGAHLARETLPIHAARTFAWLVPVSLIVSYFLVLSFLGWMMSKHQLRAALWAFFALLAIGLLYILTPTLPVTVSGKTAQATATIKEMRVHKRLLDSSKSKGIDASVPYELLVLEFIPAGRREPVLAGDMIDVSSKPGLAVGQQVAIDYEIDHPRHANIQGATRLYYWRNVEGAIISGFATIALLVGATLAWQFIKLRGKQALEQARDRARDRAL